MCSGLVAHVRATRNRHCRPVPLLGLRCFLTAASRSPANIQDIWPLLASPTHSQDIVLSPGSLGCLACRTYWDGICDLDLQLIAPVKKRVIVAGNLVATIRNGSRLLLETARVARIVLASDDSCLSRSDTA